MADENQNEVMVTSSPMEGRGKKVLVGKDEMPMEGEDEYTEEDDDFEDVDEEVSFRSVEKRKYLGETFSPKPSENAYEYVMLVRGSDGMKGALYQCRMCEFCNVHKYKVAAHIRSYHMKKAIFKCPYCDFVCRRKIEWCVHKTSHTNKFVFSCDECLYRTTMRRNFDRHLAKHQNGGPIKCPRCTYSSTGDSAIQRHITDYHSPEKEKENLILRQEGSTTPSESSQSSRRSASSRVNINMAAAAAASSSSSMFVDADGELQCNLCPMQFRTEAKLRQHMISHSTQAPHACPICSLAYKRPADLNRHMKRKHNVALQDYRKDPAIVSGGYSDEEEEEEDDSFEGGEEELDEGVYSQDSPGGAEYLSEQPMNLSVKFNTQGYQDEPLDLSTPKKNGAAQLTLTPSPQKFCCHMCDSTYRYQPDLNEHLRLIHYIHVEEEEDEDEAAPEGLDGGEWRLHCQYCPFKGQYPAEVERHTRQMHGEGATGLKGEKDGVLKSQGWGGCMFCPFHAVWKCDMRRHLQRHHITEIKMCGGDLDSVLAETYQGADVEGEETVESKEGVKARGWAKFSSSRTSGTISSKTQENGADSTSTSKLHQCSSCPFSCLNPSELSRHVASAHNLRRFKCTHCGHRSNWLWDARKHIRSLHPGASVDVAELTEEQAQASLDEYLATHKDDPSEAARSRLSQASPSKATDRCRPYMCSVCGRRSNWRWDMNKHIRCLHPTAELITLSDKEARETFDEYERSLQQQTLVNNHAKAMQQQQIKSRPSTSRSVDAAAAAATATARATAAATADRETDEVKQLVLERLRPFKCSTCGKRSNWRWDLGKHIKTIHGGQGNIIVLRSSEARASIHQFEIQQLRHELVKSSSTPTKLAAASFRSYPNIPALSPSPKRPPPSTTHSHIDVSKLKRFKCSVCAYRSNFRSDIGRHIKRKHHRGIARVTQLEPEEAAATLAEYHQVWARKKFVPTPSSPLPATATTATSSSASSSVATTPDAKRQKMNEEFAAAAAAVAASTPQKVRALLQHWQCNKCEFHASERSEIEQHVKTEHAPTIPSPNSTDTDPTKTAADEDCLMCKECGDEFGSEAELKEHCKEEHDISLNEEKEKKEEEKKDDVPAKEIEEDFKEVSSWQEVSVECTEVHYKCCVCDMTASNRSTVQEHAAQQHTVTEEDTNSMVEQLYKVSSSPSVDHRLQCAQCPYTTSNPVLLGQHSSHHTASDKHPHKCPFCSYWVSEAIALNHHLRLHANNDEDQAGDVYDFSNDFDSMPPPSIAPLGSVPATPPHRNGSAVNGRSRHYCEYCPYVSANRNDYLYHKQFHRPKPTAPFKCEHCQYWVSLQRLLKQHSKVHTVEYHMKYREERGMAAGNRLNMSVASSSPSKSDSSALSTDEVMEMAVLKQQLISSKIKSVAVTPEKIRSDRYIPTQDTPVVKCLKMDQNGFFSTASYRTMLKCRYCPYRNVRSTNLRLHEKMHGNWASTEEGSAKLLKCPYCDYHVGNAGVLARHIKVHSEGYDPSEDVNEENMDVPENNASDESDEENPVSSYDIQAAKEINDGKVRMTDSLDVKDLPQKCDYYLKESESGDEVLLEKATFRKLCCERCPYATTKRSQFEKHTILHVTKQSFTCEYCDYSVPSFHLLLQHKRLHLMPNGNLLAAQSLSNLQKLPEIPADVALAGRLEGDLDRGDHSRMDLYENSREFVDPKPTFRCDKCPYSSIRRKMLLQHLKCHMIKCELQCPYCSYSVARTHLLNQHIRVHFNVPGGKMSALSKTHIKEMRELADREEEYVDVALEKQVTGLTEKSVEGKEKKEENGDKENAEEKNPNNEMTDPITAEDSKSKTSDPSSPDSDVVQMQMAADVLGDGFDSLEMENMETDDVKDISGVDEMLDDDDSTKSSTDKASKFSCQFCSRAFDKQEALTRHENQHTLGSGCA